MRQGLPLSLLPLLLGLPLLPGLVACEDDLLIGAQETDESDVAHGCTEPGETWLAADGCNVCTCLDDGSHRCTEETCAPSCREGATRPGDEECSLCTCQADGTWSCLTSAGCEPDCVAGTVRDAGDGCNSCVCLVPPEGGTPNRWVCTDRTCGDGTCTGFQEELVNADGWVGGDPSTHEDDPLGLQGAWFRAGDDVACPNVGDNPCGEEGCQVIGSTVVDPTWQAWGCMLGLQLRSTGGDAPVSFPYEGLADCFDLSLSGATGEAIVRLGFFDRSDMNDRVGRFKEIGAVNGQWQGRLCTWEVSCPAAFAAAGLCDEGSGVSEPYALYAQIVGGTADESSVLLRIESVRPGICASEPLPECFAGETSAPDVCTTCSCTESGDWRCVTDPACAPGSCEPGAIREVGDGCNLCECRVVLDVGSVWQCTDEPCGAATCDTASEELIDGTGWIGGDPALTSDDPFGLQGGFFAFGDGIACSPPEGNPCTEDGCTVAGATQIDATYAAWGCGLGLTLSGPDDGAGSPQPYDGVADCFELVLQGETGDAPVRLVLTDHDGSSSRLSPFNEIGPINGTWQGKLCKWDVSCPPWGLESGLCEDITGVARPYQLQLHVIGGDAAGPVSLTLQSLKAVRCD